MIRIAQISDTQIRNFRRHDEYRKSYENLYASLREKKVHLIILVGDIAHTKTQISPEFVDMCVDFFKNLANIAHLIVIPGNHDGNLNNLSRMDAISPLIKAIGNQNRIHYYKDSGVYSFPGGFSGNVVVYSCFDNNWPTKEQIQAKVDPINNQINIGLFHGMVQGALLQNDSVVEDSPYEVKKFLNDVDYLMLGDIHKQQFLDKDRRSAYCGSFPQQNFGESVEKGYLLWEIENKNKHNVEFVVLPNVCPFYTLEVTDELQFDTSLNWQKGARIRVFSRQLTVFEKKELTDKINSVYAPSDLSWVDNSNVHRQDVKLLSIQEKLENLDDLAVQEKLLREYLRPHDLAEDHIQKILEINKSYNNEARKDDEIFRNIQYNLGKMKFHNTFSYGEDNEFDFAKYKGIVGVFGKNGVGKSSVVVDIPLYTIFNKISKEGVVKNDLIINEDKEDCAGEIEIQVGPDKHVITRATHVYVKSGARQGSPVLQGKTEVAYKVIKKDGTEEDCTAEQRQDTDKLIRQRFGTAEDFISTSMSPQWQLLGIVNAKSTERLKLIGRYFDIDIFAQKHKLANDEWKGIKGQLKLFEKRNFDEEFAIVTDKAEKAKASAEFHQSHKSIHAGDVKRFDTEITQLQAQLVKLDVSVKDFDDTRINEWLLESQKHIDSLEARLKVSRELTEKKNSFDWNHLKTQGEIYSKINTNKKLISTLGNACGCIHQETCSIHEKIAVYERQIEDLQSQTSGTEEEFKKLWNDFAQIKPESESKILEELKQCKAAHHACVSEQERHAEYREKNASNKDLQQKINKLSSERSTAMREFKNSEQSYLHAWGDYSKQCAILEEITKSKKEYERIKKEFDVYGHFISAMSKDGIVKKIVSDNLNIINSEIKKILAKGVGFEVEIESSEDGDGKAIEIYFKHESSKKRRIELCSGMEKSISALVIRAALINVTTLPKCNIFVLDEPFGSLDAEYKDSVTHILDYLKSVFDCVILITHDEYFRDIVDHVVEISRNDEGYSVINS